jgi:hypothetical protein
MRSMQQKHSASARVSTSKLFLYAFDKQRRRKESRASDDYDTLLYSASPIEREVAQTEIKV